MERATPIKIHHRGPLDCPRIFATAGVAALMFQVGLSEALARGETNPIDTNREVGFLAAQALHCAMAERDVS